MAGGWVDEHREDGWKWIDGSNEFPRLLFPFNFAVPQKNRVNHLALDPLFPGNWNAAKRGKYVCFSGQRCPSPRA